MVLQEIADRIRSEASEALVAKDNQQFHERELKQRNDLLLNDFNIAQQDVIKPGQLVHDEQSAVLMGRQSMTEEEAIVCNFLNVFMHCVGRHGCACVIC